MTKAEVGYGVDKVYGYHRWQLSVVDRLNAVLKYPDVVIYLTIGGKAVSYDMPFKNAEDTKVEITYESKEMDKFITQCDLKKGKIVA